jgi:hypothetical protein
MLYLNPPFYLINGVSIFGDHSDPLQFYYLPMQPHFTVIKDANGNEVPSLQLIEYKGDAGSGGFLNFDVDLSLPNGLVEDIAGELRSQAHLPSMPRLVPLQPVDGTVKLLLLGKESPAPPDPRNSPAPKPPGPADTSGQPQFVIKIQGAAKPSLYGANNATFSVQLDAPGVTLMKAAMQEGLISPIAIVYELDFIALRPAFAVKLTIDWNRIQTYLDESFNVSVLVFSASVDKAIEKLIDDRAIQIDVDTFVPEGEDDSIISDREKAVNEVREMIKSTFFESSLPPPTAGQPDGWDKGAKAANAVSELAVTGGMSSMASFSYKKVDLTRIDQKSLNVRMNERTAVRRQIYPQGHMTGMLNVVRNQGVSLDQFIVSANLRDPFFEHRNVNVVSRANFDSEQLAAITVNLKYGDDIKSVELKSSTDTVQVSWPSILVGEVMTRDVQYTYDCVFKNVDRMQRPAELQSPPRTTQNDTLELQPSAELYAYSLVPIVGLGQFWGDYPQVQVDVKYDDDDNQIHLANTFLLDQNNAAQAWQLFIRDLTKRSFQYKVTYRAANNRDIAASWITSDQEAIIVRDPLPNKRTLYVTPAIDWSQVDRVEVDVSYTESDGTISAEAHYEFTPSQSATQVFSTPLKDPSRRLVGYQVTVIKKGGGLSTIPLSYTTQPRVIVSANMKGHRIVAVHPTLVEFASKKIKQVTVDMRYADATNHLSFADTFTFKTQADRGQFEFDYVDDQQTKYQYRCATQFTNGLTKAIDWTDASDDDLVIPIGS